MGPAVACPLNWRILSPSDASQSRTTSPSCRDDVLLSGSEATYLALLENLISWPADIPVTEVFPPEMSRLPSGVKTSP